MDVRPTCVFIVVIVLAVLRQRVQAVCHLVDDQLKNLNFLKITFYILKCC